jgi:tRNA-uridine 2-sulfurtransferase
MPRTPFHELLLEYSLSSGNNIVRDRLGEIDLSTKRKAVALLSGGLDSRLAVKLMTEQGIEVLALNYVTPFCNCTSKGSCQLEAKKASEEFGVPLQVVSLFEEFMAVVKKPKYGYGSGMNPCLDCRILMFQMAKTKMEETGASFVVTGEVLGERPMSQRLDAIKTIERDSGLTGLIVRPLSAQLFEPSIPEKEGWVDRNQFLAISGRSRRPQMALAESLGIGDYPCPAGGCLLTDKSFADRLRGLLKEDKDPSKNDVLLLKVGRHFAGPDGARIVVGRNESENARLEQLKVPADWRVAALDWLGPTVIVRGAAVTDADLESAARLTTRYGKGKAADAVAVECRRMGAAGEEVKHIEVRQVVAAPM